MANEDIIQLPILRFDGLSNDEFLTALARNFKEIQTQLNTLQVYEKTTGKAINLLVGENNETWSATAANFNNRNDRIATTPANPTLAGDGTAVDHTVNTDGSADISFEWGYVGTGDAYNIDGLIVYVRSSGLPDAYTFGTVPAEEQVYYVSYEKRAFILRGVAADLYYTFGVQAYRMVDQDINASGVIKSSIVKSSVAGENPYRPVANVAFAGEISGTVTGTTTFVDRPAQNVTDTLDGFGDGMDGAFVSSGNVQWTVDSEDQSAVVKKFTNFTLNAGHILSIDKRCKGVFIYCTGNVTINGTINLNYRSAKISKTASLQKTIQVPVGISVLEIPSGGAGGIGGAGGRAIINDDGYAYVGTGGVSTAPATIWYGGGYGSGGGGGAGMNYPNTGTNGYNSYADYDTVISAGSSSGSHGNFGGGSGGSVAGRTTGAGGSGAGGGGGGGYNYYSDGSVAGNAGNAYGGGLLCIIAKGNVTIGTTGIITCNGGNGGAGGNGVYGEYNNIGYSTGGGGGGGGAGGGVVAIVYKGTYTNQGTIQVNGGSGGAGGTSPISLANGAAGTNGTVGTIVTQRV